MSAYRPSRIASPDILKKLNRRNLLALFAPHGDYFKGQTLPPSDPAQDETARFTFGALSTFLLDTATPPPPDLAKALFYIHQSATEEGEEQIQKVLLEREEEALTATGQRPSLLPQGITSPADLALHAWIIDPQILQNLLSRLATADPKSVMTYPARRATLPNLDLSRIPVVQSELDSWFQRAKRRCPGTIIRHSPQPNGDHEFTIERPEPFVRLGLIGKDSPAEFGFPQKFELVIIRRDPPEMTVVAKPKGVRDKYRECFADLLFNDKNLFEGVDKYTLEPIVENLDGCVLPSPGTSLASVTLELVHYTWGPKESMTRRSSDIIAATKRDKNALILPPAVPHHAKFALRFHGDDKPVYVEIQPHNTLRVSRHCDHDAVEAWLKDREFLVANVR